LSSPEGILAHPLENFLSREGPLQIAQTEHFLRATCREHESGLLLCQYCIALQVLGPSTCRGSSASTEAQASAMEADAAELPHIEGLRRRGGRRQRVAQAQRELQRTRSRTQFHAVCLEPFRSSYVSFRIQTCVFKGNLMQAESLPRTSVNIPDYRKDPSSSFSKPNRTSLTRASMNTPDHLKHPSTPIRQEQTGCISRPMLGLGHSSRHDVPAHCSPGARRPGSCQAVESARRSGSCLGGWQAARGPNRGHQKSKENYLSI